MRDQIIEYCGCDINEADMFLDSVFDDAILGICFRIDEGFTPAYDLGLILNKLMFINGISEDSANIMVNDLISKYPTLSFIKQLKDDIEDMSIYNNEMLFLDGYDAKCLVGIRFKDNCSIISVYDDSLCVESLVESDDMEEESAIEYFEYNTRGAYVGDNTPIFLSRL
jgi:hypothetical protein